MKKNLKTSKNVLKLIIVALSSYRGTWSSERMYPARVAKQRPKILVWNMPSFKPITWLLTFLFELFFSNLLTFFFKIFSFLDLVSQLLE